MHNLPRSSAALLRHYCRRMTDSLADTFDLGALRSPVAVHDVRRFDRAQGTPLERRWKAKIVVCTLYLAAQAVFLSLYVPVAKLPSATADTITGAVFVLSGLLAAWWCAVAWRDAVRAVRVAPLPHRTGSISTSTLASSTCRGRPSCLFRARSPRMPCAPARPGGGRCSPPPASGPNSHGRCATAVLWRSRLRCRRRTSWSTIVVLALETVCVESAGRSAVAPRG